MSKIQKLLNEVLESFKLGLAPLEAQLEEAEQKEKIINEKIKEGTVNFPKNYNKTIEEASKHYETAAEEASKRYKKAQNEAFENYNKVKKETIEKETQLAKELPIQSYASWEERSEFIKTHLAERYPEQIEKEKAAEELKELLIATSSKTYMTDLSEAYRSYGEVIYKTLEEEKKLAQELQEQLYEAWEEKLESIKKDIAEKYPEQIVEAVKLARSEGYDPNPIYQGEGESKGMSLLYFISNKLFGNITEEILPYFRSEDIKRGPGVESELMIAIKERNIEAINWLLENDPDLNYKKASGSTALHMSCMMKDYDTTKRLLEKGATPNVVNTYGCTPLFDVIISWGKGASSITEELMVKFLHLLKSHKADFNLKNNQGQTVFEQYLAPNGFTPFGKVDINYNKAALEILKLNQDIEIDLSKGYVGKFFMNVDNLKELMTQDIDINKKIATACKTQKLLTQFITEQNYLKSSDLKTLSYVEEYDRVLPMTENGLTVIKIRDKSTGEDKSYTADELKTIIKNQAIAAAQFLYDSAHSIIQDAASGEELHAMVNELINPADIVLPEQIQIAEITEEVKEDSADIHQADELPLDLAGVTLHTDD